MKFLRVGAMLIAVAVLFPLALSAGREVRYSVLQVLLVIVGPLAVLRGKAWISAAHDERTVIDLITLPTVTGILLLITAPFLLYEIIRIGHTTPIN